MRWDFPLYNVSTNEGWDRRERKRKSDFLEDETTLMARRSALLLYDIPRARARFTTALDNMHPKLQYQDISRTISYITSRLSVEMKWFPRQSKVYGLWYVVLYFSLFYKRLIEATFSLDYYITPSTSLNMNTHAKTHTCCGAGISLRTSSTTDGQTPLSPTVTHRNSGDSEQGHVCVCTGVKFHPSYLTNSIPILSKHT